MKKGGKLNPHLDNSIHPKIFLKRKYNLILFIGEDFKKKWGGELLFYNKSTIPSLKHGKLMKSIVPKKNRAVIFDTSKNSWHAVNKINNNNIYRKSMAVYYFTKHTQTKKDRLKVLYAPTKAQEKNKKILSFIKKRSSITSFSKYYKI